MREAYRLQKIDLQNELEENDKKVAVFFIYTGKVLPEYKLIFEKMGNALSKLAPLNGCRD